MNVDCDKYRINVPTIKFLLDSKTEKERLELISILAILTGVHVVITCCYIGELYGFTPDVLSKIKRLKAFYTLDRILNVKEIGEL